MTTPFATTIARPSAAAGAPAVSRAVSRAARRLPRADVEILGRTGALVALSVAVADAEDWALRGQPALPAAQDGAPVRLEIAPACKIAFLALVQRARRAGADRVSFEVMGYLATRRICVGPLSATRDEDLVEAHKVAAVADIAG